ncbi:MAG: undecaprenyl-diphosphate phosphatase [Kiritimatiellae bacterium]|nr:undecaprenyl-diphosphate phosphatase [Kiritimatiellia bacterium]
MTSLAAAILGLIEGLTEFIPISSTGHLILAADLLRLEGPQVSTFLIFIQLGAIMAVVVHFRLRLLAFLRPGQAGFAGPRGLGLLALTTLPAVVAGFLGHGFIRAHLFNPLTVAVGLGVGGLWILIGEQFSADISRRDIDTLMWTDALGIGLFQCLALWPGVSRAAATIMGGLFVGLRRRAATEYSFFAAVPIMLGACLFALYNEIPALQPADVRMLAIGFIVAFFTAWIAIKGLTEYVSHHTLVLFGWYRLALAALVFRVL